MRGRGAEPDRRLRALRRAAAWGAGRARRRHDRGRGRGRAPVVTHGDFGYVLYAIEAGEADVVIDGEVTGRTLAPGDTFGEIALLVTGRRTATIVARTDMRLLSLFDQDFRRVRDRVPELDRSLRRLGGERLAQ